MLALMCLAHTTLQLSITTDLSIRPVCMIERLSSKLSNSEEIGENHCCVLTSFPFRWGFFEPISVFETISNFCLKIPTVLLVLLSCVWLWV